MILRILLMECIGKLALASSSGGLFGASAGKGIAYGCTLSSTRCFHTCAANERIDLQSRIQHSTCYRGTIWRNGTISRCWGIVRCLFCPLDWSLVGSYYCSNSINPRWIIQPTATTITTDATTCQSSSICHARSSNGIAASGDCARGEGYISFA